MLREIRPVREGAVVTALQHGNPLIIKIDEARFGIGRSAALNVLLPESRTIFVSLLFISCRARWIPKDDEAGAVFYLGKMLWGAASCGKSGCGSCGSNCASKSAKGANGSTPAALLIQIEMTDLNGLNRHSKN